MGISSSWFDKVKSYVRSSFRNELEWGEDIKGTKYKMVNYIITRIFIMPINIHTHCFTVKGTKRVLVFCLDLIFLCYCKIFLVNTKYVLHLQIIFHNTRWNMTVNFYLVAHNRVVLFSSSNYPKLRFFFFLFCVLVFAKGSLPKR